MANIAVDIDSTLYDFETPAREGFIALGTAEGDPKKYFRGAYDPWIEWRSPADSCGLDVWLKVIALVHAPEVILSRTPFDGAVETCQALEAEGHTLMYISARDGAAEEATEQWLRNEGFLEGNATVMCAHDKTEHMRECQYLIDDRPKTAIDFVKDFDWEAQIRDEIYEKWLRTWRASWEENVKLGLQDADSEQEAYAEHVEWWRKQYERKAFVIANPYNQNLTDIKNLYVAPTWAGINHYLVSKGVLRTPAYTALGVPA